MRQPKGFSIHQSAEGRGTKQNAARMVSRVSCTEAYVDRARGSANTPTAKLVPIGWRITPLMVEPCGHGTKDLHKSLG